MKIIAAVDKNWGIGYQNQLLVRIPSDMKYFKQETSGKVVIMGRNTLESFPGGKPLGDRTNIVITSKKDYKIQDAIVVHSLEEALYTVKKYPCDDIYVVGGGSIYKQMLPFCDTVFLTKINFSYHADTYFPNIEEDQEWILAEESEEQTYHDLDFVFCKYIRSKT